MSEPENTANKPVPKDFIEGLGFELPEDVIGFYIEGNNIVFGIQVVEEVGCDIRMYESEEKFPLSDEQIQKLKDAGYYTTEGRLIL